MSVNVIYNINYLNPANVVLLVYIVTASSGGELRYWAYAGYAGYDAGSPINCQKVNKHFYEKKNTHAKFLDT